LLLALRALDLPDELLNIFLAEILGSLANVDNPRIGDPQRAVDRGK